MSTLQDAADGQPVPGKLFYAFPLNVHATKFVRNPQGPSDDKDAGWSVAVEPEVDTHEGPAGSYRIIARWDHNNFGYGFSSLNLTSGTVHQHAVHSYDNYFQAPEAQGDITRYQPVIDEIINTSRLAQASADVLAYLQNVKNRLLSNQYNSQHIVVDGPYPPIKAGADSAFTLAYTATEPRDLVVRFFDEQDAAHNYQLVEVAAGRTTVSAGVGSATVVVKAPAKTIAGFHFLCLDSLTLPVGAPEPQDGIGYNNSCRDFR